MRFSLSKTRASAVPDTCCHGLVDHERVTRGWRLLAVIYAWLALTILPMLVWTARHRQLNHARSRMPPLRSDLYRQDGPPLPAVSIVVAGKDEESNIEACLRSLIAQDYPAAEIIAVNDRSKDRTGFIMDSLRAAFERLQVVHVGELRPGWFGKNNAMREGVSLARGEWLCFTDADCVFSSPRALRVAMRYCLEHEVDFLSILPAHDAHGFWEKVIQPACSGILMIWFNPFSVNDPRRPTAYANGAFMLMRRTCYDLIGGHEAVRQQLNEDIHLARLAKQAGQRLRVVPNEDLYRVRMYESFADIWAGWSRIFYGCFGTLRRLAASLLLVLVFTMLPWISAVTWLLGWNPTSAASGPWNALGWLAIATCIMQLSVTTRFYAVSRAGGMYGLLYPIGALIGCGALLNAMRRVGGKSSITWRGTTYQGQSVAPATETARAG